MRDGRDKRVAVMIQENHITDNYFRALAPLDATGRSQHPPKNGWETADCLRSCMLFQRAAARAAGSDPEGKEKMKPPTSAVPPLHLPGRSWWLLPASAFLFAITLTIGLLAELYGSPGPDLVWDESLVSGRTTAQTGLALTLNNLFSPVGNVIMLLLSCLVLMFAFRKALAALAFGSLVSVGWLSSELGKLTVTRLRPPAAATHALIVEAGNDSFPSGHTAFAASAAWAIVLVLARTRTQRLITAIGGALLAVAVGFSRLYLGVHYPSDVIGSLLISTAGILLWLPLWNNLIEPRLRGTALIMALTGPGRSRHP
jgi:membrane-associated phospholipid phosphatase